MMNAMVVEIETRRKTSGLKSVRYSRGRSVCNMCGAPIVNVNTVTFKDGHAVDLGPECINRFLEMDNSVAALVKRQEKLILEMQSARALLDLPEDQIPVGVALNADPDEVFHFIKDPAYKGRWISHIGHMLFSPHPHGSLYLHDPKRLEAQSAKYRSELQAAKTAYDNLIREAQKKRGRLIARSWSRK